MGALEGQVGQGAGDGPRPAVPYSAPSWRGGYAEAMLGQRRPARARWRAIGRARGI